MTDKPELRIEQVLEHYQAQAGLTVKVPEGSGWVKMSCPFHGDAHASAAVHHDLNAFNCLACPYAGGPLSLIKRKEELKEGEAIEYARKVFGEGIHVVPRSVRKSPKRRPLGREKWETILG